MIRLADRQDHGDLIVLDEQCFPADDRIDPAGGIWWLAFDGDAPVGYAGLRPCLPPNAAIGYLCRGGVLERARGRGIHRALIRTRIGYARTHGLAALVTDTHPDNPPSANNLADEGFRLYRPECLWAGSRALYWHRHV